MNVQVRKQFNQRLADMQWNQFKLAELATKVSEGKDSLSLLLSHSDLSVSSNGSSCSSING